MSDKHFIDKAIDKGILCEQKHDILLKGIDKFSNDANIPVKMVCSSLTEYCTKEEIGYFRKTHKEDFGVVYLGDHKNIYMKFCALAGFYLRNSKYAKVLMVSELKPTEKCLDPSILLVPDFSNKLTGKDIVPHWRIAEIFNTITKRYAMNNFTILYIEDIEVFKTTYGMTFFDYLDSSFRFFKRGGSR